MIAIGSARLGIMVAEIFRRNRNITITTRKTVSSRVDRTSLTEDRTDSERSYITESSTDGGNSARNAGINFRMLSTPSTVVGPGLHWIATTTARCALTQPATLFFWTLSTARPICSRRTGEPLW